jgi:hypothetical protein
MVTELMLGGQEPFEIVQVNTDTPKGRLATSVLNWVGFVMVAPEAVVHNPVPLIGLLPANIAVVKQVVWFVPATEGVGLANLVMVTVLSLGAQVPLEIVHLNTLAPMPKLDTLLLFEIGLFTVPAPLTNDHTPVPIAATLPLKVAVVAHTD